MLYFDPQTEYQGLYINSPICLDWWHHKYLSSNLCLALNIAYYFFLLSLINLSSHCSKWLFQIFSRQSSSQSNFCIFSCSIRPCLILYLNIEADYWASFLYTPNSQTCRHTSTFILNFSFPTANIFSAAGGYWSWYQALRMQWEIKNTISDSQNKEFCLFWGLTVSMIPLF